MLRAWIGTQQKLRIMREHERRRANFNVWDETIVGCSRSESTDLYDGWFCLKALINLERERKRERDCERSERQASKKKQKRLASSCSAS
jgi:hypothetical protein